MPIVNRVSLFISLLLVSNAGLCEVTLNTADYLLKTKQAFLEKDWPTALLGYRTLAEQGNSEAQFKLGYLYRNGLGVKKDYLTAVYWYQKAANAGHPKAQNFLAISYELGRGISKNLSKAIFWYHRSAEQNNLNAMHWLADAYLEGTIVKQNIELAYIWFSLARDLDPDCNRIQNGQSSAKQKLNLLQFESAQRRLKHWRESGRKGLP